MFSVVSYILHQNKYKQFAGTTALNLEGKHQTAFGSEFLITLMIIAKCYLGNLG